MSNPWMPASYYKPKRNGWYLTSQVVGACLTIAGIFGMIAVFSNGPSYRDESVWIMLAVICPIAVYMGLICIVWGANFFKRHR